MEKLFVGVAFVWVIAILTSIVGYITNIVELFTHHSTLTDLVIGFAGIALPPVGIVHGIGHLFGVW